MKRIYTDIQYHMRHKSLVPAQLPNTKSEILIFKYFNTSLGIVNNPICL